MPPGSLWILATGIGVAVLVLALGWAMQRSAKAREERTPEEKQRRDAATREAFDEDERPDAER